MDNQEMMQEQGGMMSQDVEFQARQKAEQVSAKASQWGEQATEQVDKMTTQMREKANKAIESTTRGIDRMAMYLREKDSQEMMQDVQQVVRKHPGKSVLVGLALGVLVGKIMR